MLKMINSLSLFIEDCYRELGVREYSRIIKISPPTASNLLKEFEKQRLLKKRSERGFLLFRANRESPILRDLSKIYWRERLKELIENLNDKFHNPTILLFGSIIKLETKKDSDLDLVLFSKFKKDFDLRSYEKKLGRKIQVFTFKSLSNIKSKELKTNILNGYIIQGEIK